MLIRTILIIVLTLVIQATSIYCQGVSAVRNNEQTSNKVISQEIYNHVLDILFPRDEAAKNYLLVLRFGPSLHPESQIIIKGGSDKVEVVEYTSLNGNIYNQLNKFVIQGGKEDPVEMAKLIKVHRRSIEVTPSEIKKWHAGFLSSFANLSKSFQNQTKQLNKDGGITIVLDGTLYQFWYSQGVGRTSFSVWDEEVSDEQPNGVLKIVQWMNSVRHIVEKLK